MQYISFIGLGAKNKGYEVTNYHYEGSTYKTEFIQEAIIRHHINEIDNVTFFVTDESKEKFFDYYCCLEESLSQEYNKEIKFNYLTIDFSVSFASFLERLLEVINDEELLIDITHSYRSIPMKLVFTLNYIEAIKKTKILKLLYGRYSDEGSEIIDILDDYKLQELSYMLKQFDNSLIFETNIIPENDDLKNLFTYMKKFNEVIQLCNFDGSVDTCINIVKTCKKVNEKEEYLVIHPILSKIIKKLEFATNENYSYKKKRIELIKLLIKHKLYQVAITFIDQLYRLEIIRFVVYNSDTDYQFTVDDLKRKLKRFDGNIIYYFSQAIKNKIDNVSFQQNEKYTKLLDSTYGDKISSLLQKNLKIKEFYNDIRNRMNHGEMIKVKNLDEILLETLKVIERI